MSGVQFRSARVVYPIAPLLLGVALVPVWPCRGQAQSSPSDPTFRTLMAGSLEESF